MTQLDPETELQGCYGKSNFPDEKNTAEIVNIKNNNFSAYELLAAVMSIPEGLLK